MLSVYSYEAKFTELDAKNQQFQEEFRQKSNDQHNTVTLYTKTLEQRGLCHFLLVCKVKTPKTLFCFFYIITISGKIVNYWKVYD